MQKLSGIPEHLLGLRRIKAILKHDLNKVHHRAELFRVCLNRQPDHRSQANFTCELSGGQSSAWISSIAKSDGLLYVPDEPCYWSKGRVVEVATFPWIRLETMTAKFEI